MSRPNLDEIDAEYNSGYAKAYKHLPDLTEYIRHLESQLSEARQRQIRYEKALVELATRQAELRLEYGRMYSMADAAIVDVRRSGYMRLGSEKFEAFADHLKTARMPQSFDAALTETPERAGETQPQVNKTKVYSQYIDNPDYPNLSSLTQGCVSGRISEWPRLKTEALAVLRELHYFKMAAAEDTGRYRTAQPQGERTDTERSISDFTAEGFADIRNAREEAERCKCVTLPSSSAYGMNCRTEITHNEGCPIHDQKFRVSQDEGVKP